MQTSDPTATVYVSVQLRKKAVEKAGRFDVDKATAGDVDGAERALGTQVVGSTA